MQMATVILDKKQQKIIAEIPAMNEFSKFYFYVSNSSLNHEYLIILDKIKGLNDTVLSDWLNISTKTFRNYKSNEQLTLKDNLKEHTISLLSLYKHGIEVFSDSVNFEKWLSTKNILLDNKAPADFLDTIMGIKFIDNRLTAIEYGENA